VVEDDREPWWEYHPQLIEIRRRPLEECDRELDDREPVPNAPDPGGERLIKRAAAHATHGHRRLFRSK
jgi:hypothetical protein